MIRNAFASKFKISAINSRFRLIGCYQSLLADTKTQYQILLQEISRHNYLYHNKNSSIISDFDYDKLVSHKKLLEQNYPSLLTESSVEVGSAPSKGYQQCRHVLPMLSLDNCFEESSLSKFVGNIYPRVAAFQAKSTDCNRQENSTSQVAFVIEPKIDGISLAVRYDQSGKMVRAITRGDGTMGEDVTENCRYVSNVPLTVSSTAMDRIRECVLRAGSGSLSESDVKQLHIEVRGEVYISNSDFVIINSKRVLAGLVPFSTPRNAAAGGMRLLPMTAATASVAAAPLSHISDRKLGFFSYQLIAIVGDNSSSVPMNQMDTLLLLQKMGFNVATPFYCLASAGSAVGVPADSSTDASTSNIRRSLHSGNMALLRYDDCEKYTTVESMPMTSASESVAIARNLVWKACEQMEQLQSHAPKYATDGAVLKVNSEACRAELGSHSSAPRWALAYKFAGEQVVGVLDRIVIQVGRTGALTPVAKLKSPVIINGVSISQASLHNEDEVNRLGLRPGVEVVVTRAGDVIPQIVGVHTVSAQVENGDGCIAEPYRLPAKCPVCHSPVLQESVGTEPSSGEVSVVRRCSGGTFCLAQRVAVIEHYCSKAAADIRGLGPSKIRDMVYMGKLSSPADLYQLEQLERECSGASKTKPSSKHKHVPYSRRRANVELCTDNSSSTSSNSSDSEPLQQRLLAECEYSGPMAAVVGYEAKSLNNLFKAIENSRCIPLDRFLFGLGLRHVGANTCKLLAREYGSFDALWRVASDPSRCKFLLLSYACTLFPML